MEMKSVELRSYSPKRSLKLWGMNTLLAVQMMLLNTWVEGDETLWILWVEWEIKLPPHFKKASGGLPGGSRVKNLHANAGDAGSVPGLGRCLKNEMANHSSILAWEIPWTEEPGELPSIRSQKSQTGLSDWTTIMKPKTGNPWKTLRCFYQSGNTSVTYSVKT